MQCQIQVQELIINKDPTLLDNFLDVSILTLIFALKFHEVSLRVLEICTENCLQHILTGEN